MKKLLLATIALALSGCWCSSSTQNQETSDSGSDEQTAKSGAQKTKWEYGEAVDEMTDAKTYVAQIEAEEELEFDFPYDGGTPVYITLRSANGRTDVKVWVPKNKGQFNPDIMGGSSLMARFDEKPAEKYYYVAPSDYSTEAIFIKNADKFIENLKAAQKTIVQCEFFNEGTRTITFDTRGLVWEH